MKRKSVLAGLVCILSGAAGALGAGPDQIVGTWLTPNGLSKVAIDKCGEQFCGSIVWLQTPKNDDHNPDPALKGRPLAGVRIMEGFKYAGESEWTGGKMYAPERGKMASAKLVLRGDTLEVHASVGMASRTVVWTRAK